MYISNLSTFFIFFPNLKDKGTAVKRSQVLCYSYRKYLIKQLPKIYRIHKAELGFPFKLAFQAVVLGRSQYALLEQHVEFISISVITRKDKGF